MIKVITRKAVTVQYMEYIIVHLPYYTDLSVIE